MPQGWSSKQAQFVKENIENFETDFEMISFREEGNTGLVYLRTFSGTLKLLILFLTIVPTGQSSSA